MFEGKDILDIANDHINEDFMAGAGGPLSETEWSGPWDSAHYVSWCAYQAHGIVFGCASKAPLQAIASPQSWYDDGLLENALIPVAEALVTPGAILLRLPSGQTQGHVAISDGGLGIYEARGSKYGTVYSVGADIRRWDHGVLLPGVSYEALAPAPPYEAPITYRVRPGKPYLRGDDIRLIQHRLLYFGFGGSRVDGIFGAGTQAAVRAMQLWAGLNPDGEVGLETAETMGLTLYDGQNPDALSLYRSVNGIDGLSDAAADFLIFHETGGQRRYERLYLNPVWPGESSGLTIGIGYDIGHQESETFQRDWQAHLRPTDFELLAGMVGENAGGMAKAKARKKFNALLAETRDVVVPWNAAIAVFARRSVPDYATQTRAIYPEFDELPPRCRGAILSLTYNRGFALGGDRREEMASIQNLLADNRWIDIPTEIKAMKRLWPANAGLKRRRDEEADFFERGLAGRD